MIRLTSVRKSYGDQPALQGITLTVEAGEGVLLTGPSGAGKSTLLRLLFAAERADAGQVMVAGRDVARLRRASIPYLRRNIGVIFQDFKLLPEHTVFQNVALALEILDLPQREIRSRVEATLFAVGLDGKGGQRAGRLSGGEQQRVAVARAVVGEPAIVLADEPTGNLDPLHALGLLELFERLRRRGSTMMLATHDPDVIRFGTAHDWRRVRLDGGELIDTAPGTILDCDATARTIPDGPDSDDGDRARDEEARAPWLARAAGV